LLFHARIKIKLRTAPKEQDIAGQLKVRETNRDQEHLAAGKWISFTNNNSRSDKNQERKAKITPVNKNSFSIEIKTDSHTINSRMSSPSLPYLIGN
jgi:hypothetical protein